MQHKEDYWKWHHNQSMSCKHACLIYVVQHKMIFYAVILCLPCSMAHFRFNQAWARFSAWRESRWCGIDTTGLFLWGEWLESVKLSNEWLIELEHCLNIFCPTYSSRKKNWNESRKLGWNLMTFKLITLPMANRDSRAKKMYGDYN